MINKTVLKLPNMNQVKAHISIIKLIDILMHFLYKIKIIKKIFTEFNSCLAPFYRHKDCFCST